MLLYRAPEIYSFFSKLESLLSLPPVEISPFPQSLVPIVVAVTDSKKATTSRIANMNIQIFSLSFQFVYSYFYFHIYCTFTDFEKFRLYYGLQIEVCLSNRLRMGSR